MSADPSQVKFVFLKAVEECEPGQWGAFLDAACSGDVELRRPVEILLEAHLGRDSVLVTRDEGPSDKQDKGDSSTVDLLPLGRPGTRIGPYKLLEDTSGVLKKMLVSSSKLSMRIYLPPPTGHTSPLAEGFFGAALKPTTPERVMKAFARTSAEDVTTWTQEHFPSTVTSRHHAPYAEYRCALKRATAEMVALQRIDQASLTLSWHDRSKTPGFLRPGSSIRSCLGLPGGSN